jgi:glycosyltransferase involved in cell wall biosynthesis
MKQKFKILHIIKSLGRGGAEMLLPETLKLHDQERFEFHYVYFLPWKNQMVESLLMHGGKVTCFPARNNIQLMLKSNSVVRYAKENSIDVIHAHLPWAGILARIVGMRSGVPIIYTEHNKLERYHFITRWMNLATANKANEIIAVSDDVSRSIYKFKPQIRIPVRKIVNGVNTDYFRRETFNGMTVRREFGIPSKALVVGTIAVFRFQKRLDVWMDVAKEILQRFPEVHFIIIGDGPLRDELLKRRSILKMENRIHMPGLKTEVRPYLAAFDVYMMTSIFEGLPIALLEAMSMECSVAATDAGGIKEVIRHEQDGLLCPSKEPFKLVDLVLHLLNQSAVRSALASSARKRVTEAFSMKKMVDELEALYRSYVMCRNQF